MVGNPLYFFDQLGDETLFRVIPNQGHGGVAGGRTQKLQRNELPFCNNRKRFQFLVAVISWTMNHFKNLFGESKLINFGIQWKVYLLQHFGHHKLFLKLQRTLIITAIPSRIVCKKFYAFSLKIPTQSFLPFLKCKT